MHGSLLHFNGLLKYRFGHRPLAAHDLRLRQIIACGHVERPGGDLQAVLVAVFAPDLEAEAVAAVLILDGGRIVDVVAVVVVGV